MDFLSSTVPFFDHATCVTFKQSAAEISSRHIFEKFISTESLKLCSHNRYNIYIKKKLTVKVAIRFSRHENLCL